MATSELATTATMRDPMRGPRLASVALLVLIVALFVAFGVWARSARFNVTAEGVGEVVPSSQVQVIQNLEGGIVRDLPVREGDLVEKGEVVARIDATGLAARYRQDRVTWLSLLAAVARLEAEAEARSPAFPSELMADEDGRSAMAAEAALFETRASELRTALSVLEREADLERHVRADAERQVAHLKRIRDIAREELSIIAPQVENGAVSRMEQLQLERYIERAEGEIAAAEFRRVEAELRLREIDERVRERVSRHRSKVLDTLVETSSKLKVYRERLVAGSDRVQRREVRAPVGGTVKRILVKTIGGVVEPGGALMEIVPADDRLLVEARVAPEDIGFVREGQPAKVRITAYDISVYGAMLGRVERIGADTQRTRDGVTFYPVTLRMEKAELDGAQETLPLIPGMVAEVSIVTGERSVLDYVLKPVLTIRDHAFRER